MLALPLAVAEDEPPPPPPPLEGDASTADLAPPAADPAPATAPAPVDEGAPPPIEAKTFDVGVVKHSKSNKIYLFNDSQNVNPSVGKLLLLRQGEEPAMAFRIIKTYPDKAQFAAVKVRTYGSFSELPSSQVFLAVEKISDIIAPPPTEEQKSDLSELEQSPAAFSSSTGDEEILAYDPDLDAGSSPPPGALTAEPSKEENADIGSDEDISVEEIEPIDHYANWLSAQLGILSSTVPDLANPPLTRTTYFTGAGMRYGRTLVRTPFIYSARVQDSIALEAGLFFYRIVNLSGLSDSYSVLSPVGTLRYNVQVGDTYGFFVYGGAFYHSVVSYADADDSALDSLNGAVPALGVGITAQIGPSWHLRVDAGIDIVAFGLMLRY